MKILRFTFGMLVVISVLCLCTGSPRAAWEKREAVVPPSAGVPDDPPEQVEAMVPAGEGTYQNFGQQLCSVVESSQRYPYGQGEHTPIDGALVEQTDTRADRVRG